MKKKITILFIALFTIVFNINAICWNDVSSMFPKGCGLHDKKEYNSNNVETAASYLSKSGTIKSINIESNSNTTEDGTISINVKGEFYNYHTFTHSLNFWYIAQFNVFDITYNVYQLIGKNWNNIHTYKITEYYNPNIKNEWDKNYYDTVNEKIYNLDQTINAKLKYQSNQIDYKIKVEVIITPANVDGSDDAGNSNKHYISANYYHHNCNLISNCKKEYSKTSNELNYKYNVQNYVIETINESNPYKNTPFGNFNLIYGDENSLIELQLPTGNLKQNIDNSTSSSVFLVGINNNPIPTKITYAPSPYTGENCGTLTYVEYVSKSIDFLKKEVQKYTTSKSKMRFKGVMLQEDVSTSGERSIRKPTVVKLDKKENNDVYYSKKFHLSDIRLNNQNKQITSGTKLNIVGRVLYTSNSYFNNLFYDLGYLESATNSYMQELVMTNDGKHLTSDNTLRFYVVPKAEFKATTEDNTSYKCIPLYAASNDNDIITLCNKKITSIDNSIDGDIYEPEYFWEFSYDTINWGKIPENLKIEPQFTTPVGDIYLNTREIFENYSTVYIRQSAVLKAFSSDIRSELYSENIDGRYYIRIDDSQIYTYKKIPTPNDKNISFVDGSSYIHDNQTKVFVNSSPFDGKKINFNFFRNSNISQEEYTALNQIASKYITITKDNGEVITSSDIPYTISEYTKGEWKFDCRIEFCSGTSISKSFTINSYPRISFSAIKEDNKKTIYKIYSDDIITNDKRYIISIDSLNLATTNANLTKDDLKAEYFWEFSYDKQNWQILDRSYIIKPNIMIDNGDTHISSKVLGENAVVYLRRKVVLKAFSSDKKDTYFSTLNNNGRYDLTAVSGVYTIARISNITEDNITFTSGAGYASKDIITCYDNVESYNGLNIEFDIIGDANMTEEELEALRDNAQYSITRTKILFDGSSIEEDVTKTRTPNKHTVTGFTQGVKQMIFTCKVVSNNVEFVKTITLESYAEEKIDINKVEAITKGSSITFVDGASNQILAMCPKGEDFQVRYFLDNDDDRKNLAAYEAKVVYDCPNYSIINPFVPYEDVVPEVPYSDIEPEPVFVPTDYDAIDILDLYDMIRQDADLRKEIETHYGVGIGLINEAILKNYLTNKEQAKFDAELAEYRLREQAHKDAYEADSIAYTDAYHKAESEYYAQCDSIRDWFYFKNPDNYSTPLKNITDNEEEAEFLIRTKSEKGGCYSNEVKIKVTYFDGITGNVIAFTDEAIKDKQEVYVTAGEGNPYIKGELIDGAYGIPKDNEECTYTYVWKYLETQSNTWEILKDKDGNEFKFVEKYDGTGERPSVNQQFISLKAGTISNISELFPNGVEISRFVYSQRGTNSNAKLEHQSNILKIFSAKPIHEGKFNYSIDENFCPGEGNVNIDFSDIELNENEILDVKVKNADLAISINYKDKKANIANPVSDLEVAISRIDTISNVKSNEIILDIDVPEFKADFSVYVDYIEHSLSEDIINIQAGSRVVLHNNTVSDLGATVYNWTLQVQKDDYKAQRSEKEEPVCYLYNPGINKIILEATSENKCKSTIVADNINVINTQERNAKVNSFFEDDNIQIMAFEEEINVYPTILVDEAIVNIKSNIEQYNVVISDVAGKVMLTAENLTMSNELDLAFLPKGIYIMKAANKSFKIIKK